MIRDDGLVAAAVLRRYQQHAFPALAPAYAPAGLVPAPAPADAAAAAAKTAADAKADAKTDAAAAAAAAAPAADQTAAAAPVASAMAAALSPSSSSSSVSTTSAAEAQALAGQSPAETDVDRERAVMARAPGDLKPFWPKRLGPVYRANKPLAERLAAVAGAFCSFGHSFLRFLIFCEGNQCGLDP
jgi:hypothetical protein